MTRALRKLPLGEAIRVIRADRKLTSKQLADLSMTSRSKISRLENGNAMPSIDLLIRIAEGLSIRPYKIMRYAEKIQEMRDAKKVPKQSNSPLTMEVQKKFENGNFVGGSVQ